MLRSVVMKVAVEQNHALSVSTAKQMYHEWMIEGRKISVNLRDIVYYAGLKYGGEAEWNFMFEQYKSSKVRTWLSIWLVCLTAYENLASNDAKLLICWNDRLAIAQVADLNYLDI